MSVEAIVGIITSVVTAAVGVWVAIWLETRRQDDRAARGKRRGRRPAPSAVSGARLERVRERGSLRVGVINHPPLSRWVRTPTGHDFDGYYVELTREVAEREGLEVEFVAMDWGVLSVAFSELDLDIVLSIFETRARQQFADFVACLHKVGVSGVMPADVPPLTDVSELSDTAPRISVVVGEVGWEFVTHELDLPRSQLVQVDSSTLRTAFSPLVSGDADIAIVDDVTCAEFVAKNPGFQHVFTQESLYVCKNSVMVPRGEREFAKWIDRVFLEARKKPELIDIERAALEEAGGWVKRFR